MRSGSGCAHAAAGELPGGAMSILVQTEPVRTRPFAQPCLIGGRERELLAEVLESCSWSACRAGAPGFDINALCEMPSADAAAFDDQEILYLGGRWVRRLEAMWAGRAGGRFAPGGDSPQNGPGPGAGARRPRRPGPPARLSRC